MKVCFIGHRNIEKNSDIVFLLKNTVLKLINKGVSDFLFGSMSEFDKLAWEIVSLLKKDYPQIKRIYVRSAFQYISKSYEEYLLKFYEESYFPKRVENAGKLSYVQRNYEMIDCSDFCIFYYNEGYIPPFKKGKVIAKSGTKIAYQYAKKKRKQILNLYKGVLYAK